MAYTQLKSTILARCASRENFRRSSHYLLSIPSGKADKYRLAQLSDYALLSRGKFPHNSPFSLSLSARTSSDSIPGTWGFGLWNDPFGMSIGYGGKQFRIPALPNAVWFFGASSENHLSFSDKPANGFIAQTFRAPKFHPLLIPAGLALPFSRKLTRRLMSKIVVEDGFQLWNQEAGSRGSHQQANGVHSVNPTDWHRYRFEWSEKRVSFEADDVQVFRVGRESESAFGIGHLDR